MTAHALPAAPQQARREARAPQAGEHELTFREGLRLFLRFFRYIRPYRDKMTLGILLLFVGVPIGQIGHYLNRD